MFFVLYVADYELSCLHIIDLGSINVSRDFKITLTKKYKKNLNHPHLMPV